MHIHRETGTEWRRQKDRMTHLCSACRALIVAESQALLHAVVAKPVQAFLSTPKHVVEKCEVTLPQRVRGATHRRTGAECSHAP